MQGMGSRRGTSAVVGGGGQQCKHLKGGIKESKQLFSLSEMAKISLKEF